jgi:ferric-dicitrate binding protein FerR (iron transport regulator)
MTNDSFDELCEGYLNNQLTPEELSYFLELIQQPKYQDKLQQSISQLLKRPILSDEDNAEKRNIIFQRVMEIAARKEEEQKRQPVTIERAMNWRNWAKVAAMLTLLLSAVAYFVFKNKNDKTELPKASNGQIHKNDVAPGGDKAVLTLADGSTILLDNAENGALSRQGNTTIEEHDGLLTYDASLSANIDDASPRYNSISTPRGGQYRVVLADGTKVWLNAASTIRFPTAFAGKERKVEVSGEAYFEVAPSSLRSGAKMPFIVKIVLPSGDGSEVKVLGTHFNINSYEDEPTIKTTLLEGKVELRNPSPGSRLSAPVILLPGQQAAERRQTGKSSRIEVRAVDVNEVIAWKNNTFHFDGEEFGVIARQLSRWYDIEVVYDQQPKDLFYAEMPRSIQLSDALKALELTGKVRFVIEGKKIVVR